MARRTNIPLRSGNLGQDVVTTTGHLAKLSDRLGEVAPLRRVPLAVP
jgi:hypothetical protein